MAQRIGQRLLARGFGRPSGLLGRVGGWLMARGNAATERHMVDVADIAEHEVVLVVGPGPDIGLEAAARRSAQVMQQPERPECAVREAWRGRSGPRSTCSRSSGPFRPVGPSVDTRARIGLR